jgi:hypothetical protein
MSAHATRVRASGGEGNRHPELDSGSHDYMYDYKYNCAVAPSANHQNKFKFNVIFLLLSISYFGTRDTRAPAGEISRNNIKNIIGLYLYLQVFV